MQAFPTQHCHLQSKLRNRGLSIFIACVSLSGSGCSVLSIADAAVSGTVSVISTGVSATTSVVKAVLPSSKEAAK